MGRIDSRWLSLVRFANRKTKNARALRQLGVRAYSSALRANVFLSPPRVLLIGPAKSGTHLLSDCLSLMPRMMFSGRHFALTEYVKHTDDPWETQPLHIKQQAELDEPRLKRFLKGCPQGMFVTAHSIFHPRLHDLATELDFKRIVLLRDPRDVVVSFALSPMKRESWHHHHKQFTEVLKTDDERIMAAIRGFDRNDSTDAPLASIGEVFRGYIGWLEDPSTLKVRFEDLVGPRGGGDSKKQLAEIERLGNFVNRPLQGDQARRIAQKMYGQGSLTYRKGQAGGWQGHFTEAHHRAFQEVAGDVLTRLGYQDSAAYVDHQAT